MQARLERAFSVILVIAAVSIAGTLAHREFFGGPRVQLARDPTAPPVFVSDWQAVLADGIVIGDPNASVKIVEFADFECPFCRAFDARFREAAKRFRDSVSLVFVHFPLPMHRFARPAARAAECAANGGRFTQLHDVLYDKQDSLGLKSWVSYAVEAGIADTIAFARCVADTTKLRRVEAGLARGAQLGVHATPTVIINGWRFASPPADTTLAKAVAALLAGKEPPSAVASSIRR